MKGIRHVQQKQKDQDKTNDDEGGEFSYAAIEKKKGQ